MVTEKMIEAAKAEANALADRAGIDIGDDRDMFVDDLAQTLTRFAALSTDAEPVAWRVYAMSVSRAHSKARNTDFSTEAIYPASREKDARDYARLMQGECHPLYIAPPSPSVAVKALNDDALVKLAKAVIEHAPEGATAFQDIKFSDIEAALSAQVQDAAVPEGWKLIPKEPTPEMITAARFYATDKWTRDGYGLALTELYRDMLAAAPAAKQGEAE